MDFQTTLPYATDSNLHVIEGLDVTGTPIYQRAGLGRVLPVDMYILLQGIIERCLATQQADGSYLVSPTIFNETISGGEYAEVSKWTERTYPDGILNEVSGYVANLMDSYPHLKLLKAIDDKLWELGIAEPDPIHEQECIYGKLTNTPPYYEAFLDITYAMTQAGVGFSYDNFEMQCVPARITGGDPIYGPPTEADRLYPELLIDRYKVLQQLRYKKASVSDTRRFTGGASGESDWETNYGTWDPYLPPWWTCDYQAGQYAIACDRAREAWSESVTDIMDSSNLSYWVVQRDMTYYRQAMKIEIPYYSWRIEVRGYNTGPYTHQGPKLQINKGYTGIEHGIKLFGYWDGTGSHELWVQFGGDPLVVGKNTILDINKITEDWEWRAGFENVISPVFPAYDCDASGFHALGLSVQTYPPVEDWHFNFCKHHDFGGDVTWSP